MTLNLISKPTHYIGMRELCTHLSEKMGVKVDYGDSDNDTDYSISLVKGPIGDYDKVMVNEFLSDGYLNMYYGWQTMLTHCANEGWLEEGNYVIRVSW